MIVRPQPGADETAARAAGLGLEALVAPIFDVRPIAWEPPPADRFDALLLTSANAARQAGPALGHYRDLPCYCVGEATAAAARETGLSQLRTGFHAGEAVVAMAAADRVTKLLHLAGREHLPLEHPAIRIERRMVYASDPLDLSDAARSALAHGAIVLLHSPRAARHLAALVDRHDLPRQATSLLAISAAAARAAGAGWRAVQVARCPRDGALLALAAQLCQTEVSAAGTGLGE